MKPILKLRHAIANQPVAENHNVWFMPAATALELALGWYQPRPVLDRDPRMDPELVS